MVWTLLAALALYQPTLALILLLQTQVLECPRLSPTLVTFNMQFSLPERLLMVLPTTLLPSFSYCCSFFRFHLRPSLILQISQISKSCASGWADSAVNQV